MKDTLQIEYVNITDLHPYDQNPRQLLDDGYLRLKKKMLDYGWLAPLHANQHEDFLNVVYSGNQRLRIAKELFDSAILSTNGEDFSKAPVLFAIIDNEKEMYEKGLVLNSHEGKWDFDSLAEGISQLQIEPIHLPELMSMEIGDIEMGMGIELGDPIEPVDNEKADEIPEKVEKIVKAGDLWTLGRHRLLCGDSTKGSDVSTLMDKQTSEMLFTSPPYSAQRDYGGNKDLSVNNLKQFISAFYPYANYQVVNIGLQRKDYEIVEYWQDYIEHAKETGYKFLSWNIWDKQYPSTIGSQTAIFGIEHEWIFVFGKNYKELNKTIENKQAGRKNRVAITNKDGSKVRRDVVYNDYRQLGTVSRIFKEYCPTIVKHPALFPVEFPTQYIEAMTNESDIVTDPFLGSGSTLIACEQTNRICYGMEIDEHYCDVICQRYFDLTGDDPIRQDGVKWSELKESA